MADCKPLPTPITTNLKLSATDGSPFPDPSLYRSVVGSLQYVTITRPKLAYLVNKVCQFMQAPLDSHQKDVKRILRYLSGTRFFGLHLKKPSSLTLTGYSESDWGSDPDDIKSTARYCVYLGQNLISWSSKKQHFVSRSSTEAEYHGIASLVAELLWIQSLLSELKVAVQTPLVYCDNVGAVLLAANPVLHSQSKHFELGLHFVRDHVAKGRVKISHIPADVQIADILTKAILSSKFLPFRAKLNIEDSQMLSLKGDVREKGSAEVLEAVTVSQKLVMQVACSYVN